MAAPMGVFLRGGFVSLKKPLDPRRFWGSAGGVGRRCRHTGRSSLYEHVREGYSDKPVLDMRFVCEHTDRVITEVESRKGDLRGEDVRGIVSVWQELQAVGEDIARLEQEKREVSEKVRALVEQQDKAVLPSVNGTAKWCPEKTLGHNIQRFGIPSHYELHFTNTYFNSPKKALERSGNRSWLSHCRHFHGLYNGPSIFIESPRSNRQQTIPIDSTEQDTSPSESTEQEAHTHRHTLENMRNEDPFPLFQGFVPMVVPDMLKGAVFEGCGMQPHAHQSQVYSLDPSRFPDLNLAGTGEVGVAGYFMDHAVNWRDLPVRTVCSSTCYRAETDTGREAWGLYRVHHFTKVEMFGVTADETGQESSELLLEFLSLQKEIFSDLELHYRVLDMPTQELGPPAYRKFDIEAWMPGRGSFGEISSASNCTDYQSRRLHIMYENEEGSLRYAHTVNATACAVPRTIIAILETHQTRDGTVRVPKVLQPYLGSEVIEKPRCTPLRYIGPNQPHQP
uniref:serine--tRNA ligase n=1 Tax=Lepisosteus oculatus TaxID=7918 RepID=W5NA24_LEPOC